MPRSPPTASQAISQAFRCFDAVARQGSVRKAASALHLTAAAVHQQVLNFETQVGMALFDRLPRGMRLTTAGEVVLAAVRRAQRDFDQALAQVQDLRTLRRGLVNLGVPHASAETWLPGVVGTLQQRYPGIRCVVRTGHGDELLRAVARGDIDLAFCLERIPPPGVEQVRSWPQQLGWVCAPAHPLTAQLEAAGKARLRDGLGFALALPVGEMELRQVAERVAARERQALSASVETASVAMIRALAAGGTHVGLLLLEHVAQDVHAGRLRWFALGGADARARNGLYQRVGQMPSVAAGVLVQLLDAAIEEPARPVS